MSTQSAEPHKPAPPVSGPILIAMLIIAIGLPSIGTTIAIPSMPAIAQDFGIPFAAVAVTQTFYLVGLAVPQLIYGGVSDRIGRRPTILAGMGLFVAGSLLCLVSPSIEYLTVGRLAQSVGGCAGIALGRAILRDLFPREKAASHLSYITMAMTAGPMLAPVVGGFLQSHFGWRSIFAALIGVGLFIMALCWKALPETLSSDTAPPPWSSLLGGFLRLVKTPLYIFYAIPPACLTGTYQTFAATSAFVASVRFGVGPVEFGLGLLSIVGAFSFANFLSARYTRRVGIDRMIKIGTFINLFFAACLLVNLATGTMNALTFFGFMTLMNIGQGFVITNSVATATGAVPGLIGSAAGLTGFLQMGTGAFFSLVVGALIEDHVWILPAVMVGLGLIGFGAALQAGRVAGPRH